MKKKNTAQYYTFQEYADCDFVVGYDLINNDDVVFVKEVYLIDSDFDIVDLLQKDIIEEFYLNITADRSKEQLELDVDNE